MHEPGPLALAGAGIIIPLGAFAMVVIIVAIGSIKKMCEKELEARDGA